MSNADWFRQARRSKHTVNAMREFVGNFFKINRISILTGARDILETLNLVSNEEFSNFELFENNDHIIFSLKRKGEK